MFRVQGIAPGRDAGPEVGLTSIQGACSDANQISILARSISPRQTSKFEANGFKSCNARCKIRVTLEGHLGAALVRRRARRIDLCQTPKTQHSALNTQHSTLNTQHSALKTEHSTLSTQHRTLIRSTLNTQHATSNTQRETSILTTYWSEPT